MVLLHFSQNQIYTKRFLWAQQIQRIITRVHACLVRSVFQVEVGSLPSENPEKSFDESGELISYTCDTKYYDDQVDTGVLPYEEVLIHRRAECLKQWWKNGYINIVSDIIEQPEMEKPLLDLSVDIWSRVTCMKSDDAYLHIRLDEYSTEYNRLSISNDQFLHRIDCTEKQLFGSAFNLIKMVQNRDLCIGIEFLTGMEKFFKHFGWTYDKKQIDWAMENMIEFTIRKEIDNDSNVYNVQYKTMESSNYETCDDEISDQLSSEDSEITSENEDLIDEEHETASESSECLSEYAENIPICRVASDYMLDDQKVFVPTISSFMGFNEDKFEDMITLRYDAAKQVGKIVLAHSEVLKRLASAEQGFLCIVYPQNEENMNSIRDISDIWQDKQMCITSQPEKYPAMEQSLLDFTIGRMLEIDNNDAMCFRLHSSKRLRIARGNFTHWFDCETRKQVDIVVKSIEMLKNQNHLIKIEFGPGIEELFNHYHWDFDRKHVEWAMKNMTEFTMEKKFENDSNVYHVAFVEFICAAVEVEQELLSECDSVYMDDVPLAEVASHYFIEGPTVSGPIIPLAVSPSSLFSQLTIDGPDAKRRKLINPLSDTYEESPHSVYFSEF